MAFILLTFKVRRLHDTHSVTQDIFPQGYGSLQVGEGKMQVNLQIIGRGYDMSEIIYYP